MSSRTLLLVALVLAIAITACDPNPAPREGQGGGRPVVYTSFYPTTYFAQRIGGETVEVTCPVPDDADPIFWLPGDAEIEGFQSADLIVLNGAEFEKWVSKVSLPSSKVVSTADGFRDQWLDFEAAATHSHGPEGEHSHTGLDGHTWLDPALAIAQATAIQSALSRIRPESDAGFTAGLAALVKDLEALDAAWRAASSRADQVWVYASHPAYAYPARRYGWRMVNLDLDPEVMPADAAFAEIEEHLVAKPSKFLVWESTPRPEIAERVRDRLGLESVVVSPAELVETSRLDQGTTYLSIMKENTEVLRRVLTP